MSRANLFEPEFDTASERDGFRSRRARLARQAGCEHLGASLYELEPGSAAFPMHYHLGNEELLIVIAGEPSLRTRGGERRLRAGDTEARDDHRDGRGGGGGSASQSSTASRRK